MRFKTSIFIFGLLMAQAAMAQSDFADSAAPAKPPLSQEQLDQILAPIALYPDTLLSQVLMASTYPLEVVQAKRWVDANQNLTGDALAVALEQQSWDPSVKSLVNFPQAIEMMNDKLDWTLQLGDAFIEQQQQVMDTVQSLRAKAQAQGNLQSNAQQTVTVDPAADGSPQEIVIVPANPQIIYVPTYNPTIVYGPWWYPAYPPYYWYPPGYSPRPGIWFGRGFYAGVAWGYSWGHFDWRHSRINIDVHRNISINKHIDRNRYSATFKRTDVNARGNQSTWQHDPSHRDGVAYRDNKTAQRFGQSSPAQVQRSRDAYRGRPDTNPSNPPSRGGRSAPAEPRPQAPQKRAPAAVPLRNGAFDNVDRSGASVRSDSQRGQASRNASRGNSGGARRPTGGGGNAGVGRADGRTGGTH